MRSEAEVDLKVVMDIREFGWSCVAVFPTVEGPGLPFAYTVGLTGSRYHEHPELLIQGMNPEQMHGVLAAAIAVIEGGHRFKPNTVSHRVLKDLPVAFVRTPVTDGEFPLSMAWRLYGTKVQALHLVWPDAAGYFPWQQLFDRRYAHLQVIEKPGFQHDDPDNNGKEQA